jgi:HEAT repeat protein
VVVIAQFDEIFRRAVSAWRAEPYDGNAVDELLVMIVRDDPQAAVDLTRRHLSAEDADVRGTACQLLAVAAQRGDEETRTTVAELAIVAYAGERDPGVLVGIVRALGGAQDPRGLPVLTALAAHPDAQVRGQVAGDLPMVMGDPPEAAGVAALIALTADAEPGVRDWATFGLGTQTDADSDAVREALWARTADGYAEARDEAVVALARRGDPRVLPIVVDLLAKPSVGTLILEAASHLGDPSLLSRLRQFDDTDSDVRSAIAACER